MPRASGSIDSSGSYLTPPEIAKRLRVSNEKVLGWIRLAELKAVNVGNGLRPRYRISPDSLALFLASREVQPPAPHVRRRWRRPEGGPIDPELGEQLRKKRQAVNIGNKYYRLWNGIPQYY